MLGEAEQALYLRRYPVICTQWESTEPNLRSDNFHIPPNDGASVSGRHLEILHLWQTHGYQLLNVSMSAMMACKVSGHHRYFHASANNNRLLTSPTHIGGLEVLRAHRDLVDAHGWTDHVASLMPDLAWWAVCITNVEIALHHDSIQGPHYPGNEDDSDNDAAESDGDKDAWHHRRREGRERPGARETAIQWHSP